MAPKSKDPDWSPLTPEKKETRNRRKTRTSDTPLGKEGAKPKKSVGTRGKGKGSKQSKAKAPLCVLQSPNISKNQRGVRKRICLSNLTEVISISWSRKKRSNTLRRRNLKLSTFVATVGAYNITNDKGDVLYFKVYERDKDRRIFNWNAATDDDQQHSSSFAIDSMDSTQVEPTTVEIAETDKVVELTAVEMVEELVEAAIGEGDSSKEAAVEVVEEELVETDIGEGDSSKEAAVEIVEEELVETEFAVEIVEEELVETEFAVEIVEQELVETDIAVEIVEEELVETDSSKVAAVEIVETDKGDVEIGEGDSSRAAAAVEIVVEDIVETEKGESKMEDDHQANVMPTPFKEIISTNCGEAESLIDILKKRNDNHVLIHTPRKRKKMKKHRPKVVDPNIDPSSPPKPKTPDLARETKKKVAKLKSPATCKKKGSPRRKLEFDGECSTIEQEQEKSSGDGLLELKFPRKRRSMRRRLSPAKLNTLMSTIRERLQSECVSAPSQYLDENASQERNVQEVSRRKLAQQGFEGCTDEVKASYSSLEANTRIRQDNILLMQDEPVVKAMEDFLTEKIESLCIVDNVKSKQLVVRDSQKTVVVSRKRKDLAKNHKPPAVDLDEDTDKIWDLLQLIYWSEAAEAEALGDGGERMKSERKKLLENIKTFLYRMNEVQGSRKFKPWKGSVLDSIIGVFLTQNVSDHFSSSAFMTLRAKYPPLSLSEQNAIYCREDHAMTIEPSHTTSEQHKPIIQEDQRVTADVFEAPKATKGTNNGNGEKKKKTKKEQDVVDWESLRKQYSKGLSKERTERNADSVNWEAVYRASEKELASVIVDRGMNNQLAKRMKDFFDRMMKDHGSLDLEWIRHLPPLKAKDFFMSVSGLALKSTECVRLLALHFRAFPVDTNAGRFFVRVGWVPLKPISENVPFHLLNDYPALENIQRYMWPRLCNNGHSLLYEVHCHSITLAKSFCTKTKPNCNQCPMRDMCKHFESAQASAKPRLEGSQPKRDRDPSAMSIQEAPRTTCSDKRDGGADPQMPSKEPIVTNVDGDEWRSNTSCNVKPIVEHPPSPSNPAPVEPLDGDIIGNLGREFKITTIPNVEGDERRSTCNGEPTVEHPPSPSGHAPTEPLDGDIEDVGRKELEIMTMMMSGREFSQNIRKLVSEDALKVLFALNPELRIPNREHDKLKIEIRLRTVHLVFELPDSHPILESFDRREPDDPTCYHLAIWTEDEEKGMTEASKTGASEAGTNSSLGELVRYHRHGTTIKGTVLIPCLTANKGAFPLNGTYFQPHEVFADHESSRQPIDVPKAWLMNLERRFLYCGTSLASICKDMSLEEAKYSFCSSIICVRGFDSRTRYPKTLSNRFHLCKSRPANKCK